MEVIQDMYKKYQWVDSYSDPRVADWPFVGSPIPTYSIVLVYVLISCWIGPRLMRSREAFDVKTPLIIYNSGMVLLNTYILKESIFSAIDAKVSPHCQLFIRSTDPKHMRVAASLWWYYMSKHLELLDTLFFMLRKKNDQISLLHVYHHASLPCLWWIGMKWKAEGMTIIIATVNTVAHVFMYIYYGIAACGPKYYKFLWWKRWLTRLQMFQFVYIIGHTTYVWMNGCPLPLWTFPVVGIYTFTFLVLFLDFYIKAYIRGKRLEKTLMVQKIQDQDKNANQVRQEEEDSKNK